jgi:hypothetical protein
MDSTPVPRRGISRCSISCSCGVLGIFLVLIPVDRVSPTKWGIEDVTGDAFVIDLVAEDVFVIPLRARHA